MDLYCDLGARLWELSLQGLNCTQATDAHVAQGRMALALCPLMLLYHNWLQWSPTSCLSLLLPQAQAKESWLLLTVDATRGQPCCPPLLLPFFVFLGLES